jgi:signal transduction histidine kinase
VPAPVFRSICGLAMSFFVVRSLDIFQVETDRRIAEMEREQLLAADRERIGRELHDGIIQGLYATGLRLHDTLHLIVENPSLAQQRIRAVMDALDQTIQDIRRYIFDLRAAEQGRELEVVLERLVQDLRLDTFLEVDLEIVGQRCCWLDDQRVAHITQIAREALSNVVQHAEAHHVCVTLRYRGSHTSLAVVDDGQGVDPEALAGDGHQGHGIPNMQTRASLVGGELMLKSEPGRGFGLELIIPCHGEEPVEEIVDGEEVWA